MASSFAERVIGAARLDAAIYEEVEADADANIQALIVVAAAAVSSGIAVALAGFTMFLLAIFGSLMGWLFYAVVIFFVGGMALPEPGTKADAGEVLRTVGFAFSPGLLSFLGILPFVGWLISYAITVWMLVATVIAVRQALDYQSTPRAVGVCVLGWILYFVFARLPLILLNAFARVVS